MGHTMTHSPREARREATKPTGAVEVAPGIYAVDPEHIGRTVLARFTPSGRPGQYVLRAVGGHYAALDRELLELLGLPGRYNLLHRLGEQGYIRLLPISERTWMLDVDSYIQHLNAVRTAVDEGKDFWTSSRKHAFDGRRADLAPSDERADELRDQAVQVQELLEDEAFLNAWAEHIRRVEQKTGESFKPAHKRRALARLAALGGIERVLSPAHGGFRGPNALAGIFADGPDAVTHAADLDALGVHVDDHHGDAVVLGDVGVGAHGGEAEAGDVGAAGPYLLAVEQPAAVDPGGPGGDARRVGAGVGLAEQLAPDHLLLERGAHPAGDLVLGGVLDQREDHPAGDAVARLLDARRGELLLDHQLLDRPGVATPRRGPVRHHVTGVDQLGALLIRGEALDPLGEGPDLVPERLGLGLAPKDGDDGTRIEDHRGRPRSS